MDDPAFLSAVPRDRRKFLQNSSIYNGTERERDTQERTVKQQQKAARVVNNVARENIWTPPIDPTDPQDSIANQLQRHHTLTSEQICSGVGDQESRRRSSCARHTHAQNNCWGG